MKRRSKVEVEPGFVRKTHARCEDCDTRGDLTATGRPVRWSGIVRCSGCAGKGEVKLSGSNTIDPYAKDSRREPKQAVYKPWDEESLRQAGPRETAELDAIARLMTEPPHGHNHGRATINGIPLDGLSTNWRTLETEGVDSPSVKRDQGSRRHGTAYAYRRIGCRCDLCKEWKRGENARRPALKRGRYRKGIEGPHGVEVKRGSRRTRSPVRPVVTWSPVRVYWRVNLGKFTFETENRFVKDLLELAQAQAGEAIEQIQSVADLLDYLRTLSDDEQIETELQEIRVTA